MSRNRSVRGFGLVEFMVAVTVSALLVLGIAQLFISGKDNFRTLDALSSLQENSRFAIHTLTRDLRQSGLYGCRSGKALWGSPNVAFTNTTAGTTFTTEFSEDALVAFDGAWIPTPVANPNFGAFPPLANNDRLAIRGARIGGTRVVSLMANATAPVEVASVADFAVNDFAVITDCQAASVARITAINTAPKLELVHGQNLTREFGDKAEAYVLQTVIYYLASGAGGVPALFRKVNDQAPQELIRGVERLRIEYGEDLAPFDGTADRYVAGSAAGLNMRNVVSLRIGMLMVSEDSSVRAARSRTFNLLGENFPSNDRLQRQVVVSTISLRNRTL